MTSGKVPSHLLDLLKPTEPVPGIRTMSASSTSKLVAGLSKEKAREVGEYEKGTKKRKSVLLAVERNLKRVEWPPPASFSLLPPKLGPRGQGTNPATGAPLRWRRFDGTRYDVVHWGLGQDSTAILVLMAELRVTPKAIVFSDTGGEWPETLQLRDEVYIPWLRSKGFPEPVLINRWDAPQWRTKSNQQVHETLEENCLRITKERKKAGLPSAASGKHSCSLKYKAEVMNWWYREQPWAQKEWEDGRRIVKVIGYHAGEPHRTQRTRFGLTAQGTPVLSQKGEPASDPFRFGHPGWEGVAFLPYYPLSDWGITREEYPAIFERNDLPLPQKSACWFCGFAKDWEWLRLRRLHPELFERAVYMEDIARPYLDKPESAGLRFRGRSGQKQLGHWAAQVDEVEAEMISESGGLDRYLRLSGMSHDTWDAEILRRMTERGYRVANPYEHFDRCSHGH